FRRPFALTSGDSESVKKVAKALCLRRAAASPLHRRQLMGPPRTWLVCTACALLIPSFAWAQGGPPLITDDPDTPRPGYWEINLAGTAELARHERRIELPLVDLNYGVGRRIQLKFEVPFATAIDSDTRARHGLGNATAGIKWRFLGEEGKRTA